MTPLATWWYRSSFWMDIDWMNVPPSLKGEQTLPMSSLAKYSHLWYGSMCRSNGCLCHLELLMRKNVNFYFFSKPWPLQQSVICYFKLWVHWSKLRMYFYLIFWAKFINTICIYFSKIWGKYNFAKVQHMLLIWSQIIYYDTKRTPFIGFHFTITLGVLISTRFLSKATNA